MNNKVAILGCAKNCAKYISTTINNMHRLGSLFSDYHIFIYENDSLDNTDSIIRQHGKSAKVTCKTQRFIHYKYKYRTWALAYARNCLINMLIESKFNPEYVIVMDMDDIGANHLNKYIKLINYALSIKPHWDAIFPKVTYDYWAFRYKNCLVNYIECMKSKYLAAACYNNMQNIIKKIKYNKKGLAPVYSTFNGIGLYKYNLYIKGTYSGKNILFSINAIQKNSKSSHYDDSEECEHVNFHQSLGPCRLMMCKKY